MGNEEAVFRGHAWSPDGELIAGSVGARVAVYSFETGRSREFDQGAVPIWLGDNRHLLFRGGARLGLLDITTGDETELLDVAPNSLGALAFDRDNGWIYFVLQEQENDIYLLTREQ